MLAGARISLLVGLIVVVDVVGRSASLLGAIAGYFGGRVDDVISRVIDVLLAFPGLLLAIALVAVLGPSLANVVFALTHDRLGGLRAAGARAGAARARVRVRAGGARARRHARRASCCGTSSRRRCRRSSCRRRSAWRGAILGEAALSFLGLGVQPPTPSWGTMLNGGRAHLLDAPHLTIFPGLAIALLVLGFNFLGDGLRDALDPDAPSGT